MSVCRESEKLNAFIGKTVRIVFFDKTTEIGVFAKGEYGKPYRLIRECKGDILLYKSHIKKIDEVKTLSRQEWYKSRGI